MDPASARRRPHLSGLRITRDALPFWLFVAFIAAALPLIVLHIGSYHWFLRDEWIFLTDRGGLPDLFEPNGGAHPVVVPRVLYAVLWELFGLTTYRPYQLCVVVLHLTAAVLLRVVMRRCGVRPWLASAAAALIVLFGPGAANIVWAFQVTFTGSVTYGLAHLLLADHDGPFDRRDLLGLGFGLLAIASSAVGVAMTVAVVIAVLLRRGWKLAFVHGAPLAVIFVAWVALVDAETTSAFGRPTPSVLFSWVRSTAVATFQGMGHFEIVAWLYAILLVVGLGLAVGARRDRDLRALRAKLAMPAALVVGALFFAATTGLGRWWIGDAGARASRYVHLEAALLLPLLAVAMEAIAARWRALTPVLVAALLLPIPFNIDAFDQRAFGEDYMAQRRYILTTAVRMPFARDVPRDVQPVPDPFSSEAVTIGFLRTAEANGDLTPSSVPLTQPVVDEFKVRLGVAQRRGLQRPDTCNPTAGPIVLDPDEGDVFYLGSRAAIATQEDGRATSPRVLFNPRWNGTELTIELPDLHLRIAPVGQDRSVTLCEEG